MASLMEDGEIAGNAEAFNIGILRSYLASLLLPVMGAARHDLESSLFDDATFEEKCSRFASDAGCMVVYVTKEVPSSTSDGEAVTEDTSPNRLIYTLNVPPIPSHSPSILSTLALIKRTPYLDASVPLASQLHFVLLSAAPTDPSSASNGDQAPLVTQATPYEGLHSLVHWGVAPWFDSYVSSKKGAILDGPANKKGGEAQMGIPVAKRKFAELELSLLHLQQNVEIPETHLSIHPAVRKAVEQSRATSSRPSIDAISPASLLDDTPFLNRLQSDVNSWIKEVQTVTKMSRDVASGTASQEINFWLSMERALEGIDAQLRGDEVVLALDVLKHAKRFHATVSFLTDTGLVEAIDVVHKYNILMKDFPLNELLSATDLDKVQESLYLIFGHINKKLKLSPYPIRRALPLVEAISLDFSDQLLKVLGNQRPMYMEYETFERSMTAAADVFLTWDENMKEFTNVAREVSRKRSEKFIPIKITPAHAKLQERIAFLRAFRRTHEQLRVMTGPTRGLKSAGGALTDIDMEEEVRLSYESVKNVDVLDVSVEGTQIWVTAEAAYNDRVARIENQIIARLRDKLGKARNAQEMFRVFSKFNTLFVRPKIRGAIQEYQTRLIESVKEDIKRLHLKFTTNYRVSEAHHMSQMRDLPPVAGAIIWARQIDRQLSTYMRRVEDVLGKGWESYAEGQKLQAESQSFKRKLDTKPVYDAWLADITRRGNSAITGRLFDIVRGRTSATNANGQLQLAVNFDPQVITLFKEVRHLMWLNFQVPLTISHRAKDAKRVYPHAVSLMESVRTFTQVSDLLATNPQIVILLADYRSQAQQMIAKGMALQWDFFVNAYDSHRFLPATGVDGRENKHFAFVRDFASMVSTLQDKANYLIDTYTGITAVLEQLDTCDYTAEAFSALLIEVQKTVDRLSLEGYANLEDWVLELDRNIESTLFKRVTNMLLSWMTAFESAGGEDHRNDHPEAGTPVNIRPLVHEIRIRNQVIYLDPPIEYARKQWLQELQELLWVVCGLKRIRSTRYELRLQVATFEGDDDIYRSLLTQFTDDTLERSLTMVENKVREVSGYVAKWLQFQSLWDLEADYVYNRLGDSLGDWGRLLSEIRQTRSTFDNSDTQKSFGACIIDYANAQSKVNAKYDTWQRDLLSRYGGKLGTSMKDTNAAILKARGELEVQSIEGSTTAQAVTFITFVQDLKRRVIKWAPDIEIFAAGEKTLERQRYQFGNDWLYVDQVQGEWSAFNEILKRKDDTIRDQISGLQLKIVAEDRVVDGRITELVTEWESSKPLRGNIKAEDALNTVNVFEGRLNRLQEDFSLVCRAKEALDLEQSKEDRLTPVTEELRDLKAVWTALSGLWQRLGQLKETNWVSVQPRKLRLELDHILASTKEMPSRMRQYAAFEYVQDTIRGLLKANIIVSELKSEALRERHWSKLLKVLRVTGHYSVTSLTLGHIYDLDLKRNEKLIKEVIIQAQGEMALEEFLKQVKETWTTYSLDLTNYQNKCRLIRGWDDLFTKCSENINSLAAMKMSPYYKVFEEEATSWEDKLNRAHVLFDVWIDVQRQWVYLEGIFSGSADIKHLLPVESARFQNINSEFLTVLKKVYKSPLVLDVLGIPGVQKSMERLADLLSKIQKALGEYLERERASFPRFYFVGDEDLLEIIGNSKDIRRVMKHFKKMFAGISSILLDGDENATQILTGFASKEGEEVMFKTPIDLKDYPRINDWLGKIDSEMRLSLAFSLSTAVAELEAFFSSDVLALERFFEWVAQYPAQLVVLAVQITWTNLVESAVTGASTESLGNVAALIERTLDVLADNVLTDLAPIQRRKCEHLITELVHQRDVVRQLVNANVTARTDFVWLYHMRFYLDNSVSDPLKRLEVRMADAVFPYGYEYLGVPDRLVQTPLTDKCYLTLTQALDSQLGGSPFGPAGTGKTESVKALGVQLGRFVLVFCCDETFDFMAMGRIFVGLCQVGAWGCFDEFNRLEERILSAVSQQIQSIQQGLARAVTDPSAEVEMVGKRLKINPRTGIFITMNPGYAGRSNLPDNLKKLFRSMAMTRPDLELIAQVMLFSQGFRAAEALASKIVPFFNLCAEQLSPQPHYDFGLRALKSVLVSAGLLKRSRLGEAGSEAEPLSDHTVEQQIVIQSVTETIVPKLVADDVPLLTNLLADVFPGISYVPVNLTRLSEKIASVCEDRKLVQSESWISKVVQLYQIQNIAHGLMMVGPSGTGKSEAWQVLLAALERLDGIEGVSYVINPKAMDKDSLYGTLDPTTREWNDGLFTHILRKIIDNVRGEATKRHWIIFDGDVDPEWVENLNSVLDDNRLLTLPNGERLNLPPNVRIMFEVEHLKSATLATVSRCGMIWFSHDVVVPSMLYNHYLSTLESTAVDADDDETATPTASPRLATQRQIAQIYRKHFEDDGIVEQAIAQASEISHIMDFTMIRALGTLFSLLNQTVRNVLAYDAQHPDFPLSADKADAYVNKRLLINIVWAFAGDANLEARRQLGDFLRSQSGVDLPPGGPGSSLIDYDVDVNGAEWISWQSRVPVIEIETHAVTSADVVVPTIDTIRHEEVLYSWLAEHKPLILCGPPGSGKTMTLFSALRKLPDLEVAGLNFSSATTPELILKTFEQYCEYRKTPSGVILSPPQIGRWLVVFCDEINLPACDKYGTQRVVSFLRQLIESNGFWRTSDLSWVRLERIQFVGACNPPTDPGRVPLSHRFLRHAPLVMVDYPGEISLKQIYGTFNRALLKVVPNLRGHAEPLTQAMVSFYLASQKRFTTDVQAHYVYSPRELTRWMRGIYEALKPLETLALEGLVRVWAHEGLRLFSDRLVTQHEKTWTDENLDAIAMAHFPNINKEEALSRPLLFSNWTTRNYTPVNREQLREYTKARLRVFHEEELDVELVLFNDVLDHVLRIDRVFRQVQGHLLLIGVSGGGKTTLSRFVAWMNGLSIYQIKVSNKYTGEDFDEDLRNVLRRSGCKGEKICFIMDESNVLDSGFLERMNTLLANAEIPGLFEGDEYAALMTACKEGSQRDGLMLDSQEELYRWFTQQVARNLHVVFTMNPPENGLASRAATSPALFNRCVLDWFGDWTEQALFQVALEFTQTLDLDGQRYAAPLDFPVAYQDLPLPPTHRHALINAMVHVHKTMYDVNAKLARRQGRHNHVTPRHYLDFIDHFVRLFTEKRDELEEQQRHLNIGLDKLRDTVVQVEDLRKSLAIKRSQLEMKDREANLKLRQMVTDQQEAEAKKAASIEIQAALVEQDHFIQQRREIVMSDLAEAEPAVVEALAAVGNIRKQHLSEVRSMANPPEAVKMAMESACSVLGHQVDSWKTVQSIIRKDDFIASIQNFDTNKMTKAIRERMIRDYISRPNFNYEVVNRASRACGPLVQWVIAQVRFSEILDKVEPLRQEVQSLEEQAATTKEQAQVVLETVAQLEASIERYKQEYAVLISDTQTIKGEMERVQGKVDRSVTLLDSLSSEQTRWDAGSRTFDADMSTISGDVLLAAAFLAYGGFFDQQYREAMWLLWTNHLQASGLLYRTDLSLAEFLSTADDRLGWQARSLPADNLCTENAIMLKRYNRYPLIIDPTGQAAAFLQNEYRDRKITVTSFLDEAFLKNLESALRFGNPLLIQDVEHLDPILNAVLNKEIRRTGGRVLIRLGNQDIDFSPAFTMFMSTRDSSVDFPADICSRVTFVNFTMTRSSLMTQALDKVLKTERPETDQKRNDLMRLQGEFRLRLLHLEKSLLQALNESTGNILDDDKVIATLETLKTEAAEVTRKVQDTDIIMAEVEQVTAEYLPLAQACSAIYFLLDQFGTINHFYQFSLRFFLDIFDYVLLQNPQLAGVTDSTQRLQVLLADIFLVTYARASRSLLHQDHVVLAVLLARLRIRGQDTVAIEEVDALLEVSEHLSTAASAEDSLSAVSSNLKAFAHLPAFEDIVGHLQKDRSAWAKCLEAHDAENESPDLWPDASATTKATRTAIIMSCVRPERVTAALAAFSNTAFGVELSAKADYDLMALVEHETAPNTPIAMCSVAGYDASYRVDHLVEERKVTCVSVAMGSPEGYALADQAIATAARSGTWVLLKNVHLAPAWLTQLEKRLHGLSPNPHFRLFLTMEVNPAVPVNILRRSNVVMNEPPPGIRANLFDSLKGLSVFNAASGPAEKSRLFFLLAWFHAVIQERLRFTPMGWSKLYEFNDSDFDAARQTIDAWLSALAKGRANVDPAQIPWVAIRTLIKQAVYGGRIDSDFDQRLLDVFVDQLFSAKAYDVDFSLVPPTSTSPGLAAPEGTQLSQFTDWVMDLPEREPSSWLGLPAAAERVMAIREGDLVLSKLRKMRNIDEDDETVAADASDAQPAWLKSLAANCSTWLKLLPENLPDASLSSQDPLSRFFARELQIGSGLLKQVRQDLEALLYVADGSMKQTNNLRSLMEALTQSVIPVHWKLYKVAKDLGVSKWISDLSLRLQQLQRVSAAPNERRTSVWLGGLFQPAAYVTATRQAIAHQKGWSLEELVLRVDIEESDGPEAFVVEGLTMEGACWQDGQLALNDGESTLLKASQLSWSRDKPDMRSVIQIPVYLNTERSEILFTMDIEAEGISRAEIIQRGLCLTAVTK